MERERRKRIERGERGKKRDVEEDTNREREGKRGQGGQSGEREFIFCPSCSFTVSILQILYSFGLHFRTLGPAPKM